MWACVSSRPITGDGATYSGSSSFSLDPVLGIQRSIKTQQTQQVYLGKIKVHEVTLLMNKVRLVNLANKVN